MIDNICAKKKIKKVNRQKKRNTFLNSISVSFFQQINTELINNRRSRMIVYRKILCTDKIYQITLVEMMYRMVV